MNDETKQVLGVVQGHLPSEEADSRLWALERARDLLRPVSPIGGAPDLIDMVMLADYILTGDFPFDSDEEEVQ